MIEVISQFVRIISLSVRLFANILAGHLLSCSWAAAWPCCWGSPRSAC